MTDWIMSLRRSAKTLCLEGWSRAVTSSLGLVALVGCVAVPNPAYDSGGVEAEAEAEAGSGSSMTSGSNHSGVMSATGRPSTPPSLDTDTSRGEASSGSDAGSGELPSVCGDGIKHPDERCDAGQLDGWDCTDFGFGGGELSCDLTTCDGFGLAACVTCGALGGGAAPSCLGQYCESDDDCVTEAGEQCCTAPQCANTCMIPCIIDDCPNPIMGCEHGYCLFPCDDDADCEPWFGYTCQHGMRYCENDELE